jgi:hypothetical protein
MNGRSILQLDRHRLIRELHQESIRNHDPGRRKEEIKDEIGFELLEHRLVGGMTNLTSFILRRFAFFGGELEGAKFE